MDSNDKKLPSLTDEEMQDLVKDIEDLNDSGIIDSKKTNYESLNSVLGEYLDSYVLLGYTMVGDEVVCHRLKSTRDVRSLSSLMEEIAMSNYISQSVNYGSETYSDDDEDDEDYEE